LQLICFRAIIPPTKARIFYEKDIVCLPWQDLSQVTDAKLYNAIPRFATGLPLLYYSHTTFENNHILPQHDENNSRLYHGGGYFHLFENSYLAMRRRFYVSLS